MEISKPGQTESDAIRAASELTTRDQETLKNIRKSTENLHDRSSAEVQTKKDAPDKRNPQREIEVEKQRILEKILEPFLSKKTTRKINSTDSYEEIKIPAVKGHDIIKTNEGLFLRTTMIQITFYRKLENISLEELQAKIEESFPTEI